MNKISFGMPQLLELESLEQNLKLATSLNLDYVELNMNLPQMQPHLLNAKELIELSEKYQMTYTAHLPEDLDVGHFNKHIRKAHLKVIEESIELAQAVGIKKLNMHMNKGIHFTLPSEKIEIYQTYQTQYYKNIRESLNRMSTLLNKYDVTIVIENTGLFNREHICSAVDILLENPKINLTWDVGHDYIYKYGDQSFMKKHESRIKHFHLHDAKGKKDHLPLYSGDITFDPYFELAKQNQATCLIEIKTVEALIKSIKRLRA